jgi:hypothetical protein
MLNVRILALVQEPMSVTRVVMLETVIIVSRNVPAMHTTITEFVDLAVQTVSVDVLVPTTMWGQVHAMTVVFLFTKKDVVRLIVVWTAIRSARMDITAGITGEISPGLPPAIWNVIHAILCVLYAMAKIL